MKMDIKLIKWPDANGSVWIVSESINGYSPIKRLETKDITSELAKCELEKALSDAARNVK
jgi:hypothetical protein